MEMFMVENNVAKPHTETILIPPFKDLWERDESPSKEKAIMDFTFIELMCSPKKSNPFFGYPEDKRGEKIISQVFKGGPYIADTLVYDGMRTYLTFLTEASPTYATLRANRLAAEKTNEFLTNFSYTDVNPKTGLPIYKAKEITDSVKNTQGVILALDSLEKKVQEELFEATKTKGMREIGHFERRG